MTMLTSTLPLRFPPPSLTRLAIILTLLLAACTGKPNQPAGPVGPTPSPLTLTSPAFAQGEAIPGKYTCQGDDASPALQWSAPPPGTKSLALIVDDPDAPGGTWVHWVIYNIPPEAGELAEEPSFGACSANSLATRVPAKARCNWADVK